MALTCLLAGLAGGPGLGCRATRPMPPVDLTQPGWQTREGQAVWTIPDRAVEIAGSLLVSRRGDNEALVQFSKGPVLIVSARRHSGGWSLEIPARQRIYSGRGSPPQRIIWFQLAAALRGSPNPKSWTWKPSEGSAWSLQNSRTGERLEGVFIQ